MAIDFGGLVVFILSRWFRILVSGGIWGLFPGFDLPHGPRTPPLHFNFIAPACKLVTSIAMQTEHKL